MTKKHFREHWEAYFLSLTDAELYAVHVWVHSMQTKGECHGYVGKIWDTYTRAHASKEVAESKSQEGRSVH